MDRTVLHHFVPPNENALGGVQLILEVAAALHRTQQQQQQQLPRPRPIWRSRPCLACYCIRLWLQQGLIQGGVVVFVARSRVASEGLFQRGVGGPNNTTKQSFEGQCKQMFEPLPKVHPKYKQSEPATRAGQVKNSEAAFCGALQAKLRHRTLAPIASLFQWENSESDSPLRTD